MPLNESGIHIEEAWTKMQFLRQKTTIIIIMIIHIQSQDLVRVKQIQCIKYYGSVRVYSKADYVNKCLIYQPLNLMGEFTYFQQGSWRFVSMRGYTRITRSRADASYLFPANDEKRAGATKGIIHHLIEFKRGWSPFYAI